MPVNMLAGLTAPKRSAVDMAGVGLSPDATQMLGAMQQVPTAPQPQPPQAGPMGPSPFMTQPVKPKMNLLANAVDGFQRGFDPQGWQAGKDKAKTDQAEAQKKQIALMQNIKALPLEQRMRILPQLSQQIGRPIPPELMQDQAIDEHLALMMGQAGMAPEAPTYMNLGGGAVGKVASGKFSMEHEAPQAPDKPTVVNGRVLDPNDPTKVIADYSDSKPPNWQTEVIGDQVVAYNPQNPSEQKVLGPAPAKGGNGIQLQFGEGGVLSGLSVGGTGQKGQEPAVVRGPDGKAVVTPGKQQLVANKSYQALQSYEAQNKVVQEDIKRAIKQANGITTGLVGGFTKDIPGTPAHDLANLVNTIKANIGFDKLQQMRAESPTGGALGQVSEQENRLLQSVLGALEQSQTQDQFLYNLNRLNKILTDNEARKRDAFAQDYPDLAEYTGFAKGATEQGNALQSMSTEELQKRLAQLKGGQ